MQGRQKNIGGGQRSLLLLGRGLDLLKLRLTSLVDEFDLPTLVELDVALAHHVVGELVCLIVLLGPGLLDGQLLLELLESDLVSSCCFLGFELGSFVSGNLGSRAFASKVRLHHASTSTRLGCTHYDRYAQNRMKGQRGPGTYC